MSLFGFLSSSSKPLPPKLTPPGPAPSLHASLPHANNPQDQWEHVKPATPSSPTPTTDDEASFVTLAASQVETWRDRERESQSQSRPNHVRQIQRNLLDMQQENLNLRDQLDASRASLRKVESERTDLQSMMVELRLQRSKRERSSGPLGGGGFVGATADVVALREENEKLKAALKEQTRKSRELEDAARAHKEQEDKLKATLQHETDKLHDTTTERDRLRKDRDAVICNLTAEIERLKTTMAKQSEETKGAIEAINRERSKAQADLLNARKSLDSYAAEFDKSVKQTEDLRYDLLKYRDAHARAAQDNKELHTMLAELKKRLDAQSKDLRIARDESSTLKKSFNQLSTLLDDRTSELKGAQSFLTTADAFSGQEVISTLQRLNAEVLQSTAFMAESMVEAFMSDNRESKTEEQIAGGKRAASLIGGAIVHFLSTKKHKEDPILIQIAFQAYLAYSLRYIATAWVIGGDEAQNLFIHTLYEKVRDAEAQAISGRWRALTRAHLPRTQFDELQLTSLIASKIITGLSDILLAAGCSASSSSASELTTALSEKFTEKISFLVSLAIRVNKIIGEDVTSGDLEVVAVQPGTPFNGEAMEDSYDDGVPTRSGARHTDTAKVLCATDLGLRKRTKIATTGEEKRWEKMLLLKPKVALESIVDIMDE